MEGKGAGRKRGKIVLVGTMWVGKLMEGRKGGRETGGVGRRSGWVWWVNGVGNTWRDR